MIVYFLGLADVRIILVHSPFPPIQHLGSVEPRQTLRLVPPRGASNYRTDNSPVMTALFVPTTKWTVGEISSVLFWLSPSAKKFVVKCFEGMRSWSLGTDSDDEMKTAELIFESGGRKVRLACKVPNSCRDLEKIALIPNCWLEHLSNLVCISLKGPRPSV